MRLVGSLKVNGVEVKADDYRDRNFVRCMFDLARESGQPVVVEAVIAPPFIPLLSDPPESSIGRRRQSE